MHQKNLELLTESYPINHLKANHEITRANMKFQIPVTAVKVIMKTENIGSRARVGLLSSVSMVLATKESSIVITTAVRIAFHRVDQSVCHTISMANNTRRKE